MSRHTRTGDAASAGNPHRGARPLTRREFIRGLPVAAGITGTMIGCGRSGGAPMPAGQKGPSRVVVGRDERLAKAAPAEHVDLLVRMLDSAVMKLTGAATPRQAWSMLFTARDVVGIKVNTLGRSTHPQVAQAIAAGIRQAGVSPDNIIIWDRFDVELAAAGYTLNHSAGGVKCYGTDSGPEARGGGYESEIETSGEIGSCFSRIVARKVTALVSVPVLKHHDLAGLSGSLKNFYGAIHNPNKYHEDHCSPYVADVVRHRYIGPKLRLAVFDGIQAQYHAGPGKHPAFSWPFAGLLVGTDLPATDRIAAEILDAQRTAKGLKTLAQDQRPIDHVLSAAERGLGVADLSKIERIEI